MKHMFKQAVVTTLTLAMITGGTTAAFADGKGKRGKDNDRDDKRYSQTINVKHSGNIRIDFSDLKGEDVEWAARYIASLASKQVFEGYEDGTFKPRNTISRIEAITAAVRLMGLREEAESAEAKNTSLNFKDANQVAKKYPWAVGYVAVALENDLFTESADSVQPEKAADRLWATTLLVKALKLDAEAKAKMNTKLTFKDANQIPAGSIGYVAVAVEKGLIEGYENNTFRPNSPVTRAELAALLDRTGEHMDDYEKDVVKGTVQASVTNHVLNVTTAGNVSKQIALDPNAFVFRNNVRVAFSALQPGDEVRVKLFNNVAIYVEVTKAASETAPVVDFVVSGRVYDLQWKNGKIEKIAVNTATYDAASPLVTYYNVDANYTIEGNASQLVYDRPIVVRGSNQTVKTITVLADNK